MLTGLPLVAAALHDVPQVGNHACDGYRMPAIGEIESPGVAQTLGEDLEPMPGRVIAPDTGVDPRPFGGRCAGFPDAAVREDTVRAVQPAVGSPDETVEGLVRVLVAPAVEQDLGRPGRLRLVAVGNRNEHQVGCCADPYASEAHFETTDEIQVVGKDSAAIEGAV